jgi:hypothetical protein
MSPFPVDDVTLDMLLIAVDPWTYGGNANAERSTLGDFLVLLSELGGSDSRVTVEENDTVVELRDPQYSHGDVIIALVREIQRLRARDT